jgi:hypothetical protein
MGFLYELLGIKPTTVDEIVDSRKKRALKLNIIEKAAIVAEELGHYYRTDGDWSHIIHEYDYLFADKRYCLLSNREGLLEIKFDSSQGTIDIKCNDKLVFSANNVQSETKYGLDGVTHKPVGTGFTSYKENKKYITSYIPRTIYVAKRPELALPPIYAFYWENLLNSLYEKALSARQKRIAEEAAKEVDLTLKTEENRVEELKKRFGV